jgi:hypothetical protein
MKVRAGLRFADNAKIWLPLFRDNYNTENVRLREY